MDKFPEEANRRDSIASLLSLNSPRESFGLIRNTRRNSLDFGNDSVRESLGVLNMSLLNNLSFRESLDSPRESLGILNMNLLDSGRESVIFALKRENKMAPIPEISVAPCLSPPDTLNTGFVEPGSKGSSVSSCNFNHLSGSSLSSIFNSFGCSSSVVNCKSPSVLNKGFFESLSKGGNEGLSSVYEDFEARRTNDHIVVLENLKYKRILSLPSYLEGDDWGAGRIKFGGSVNLLDVGGSPFLMDLNVSLNDSVFATADNKPTSVSIFDQVNDISPQDLLDSTLPPEDMFVEDSNPSPPPPIQDSLTVFKAIDKMIPSDTSDSSSKSGSSTKSTKKAETRDILNNLSAILKSECRSATRQTEGENFISQLADILLSSPSRSANNLEDSGHSSVGGAGAYDRSKSVSNDNESGPLDLSLRSKSTNNIAPMTRPIYNGHSLPKIVTTSFDGKSDGGLGCASATFKPKKVDPNKKGPLKAVMPINTMTKKNLVPKKMTPPRLVKMTKTSTPVNDKHRQLVPMAHSTPDAPARPANRSSIGSPRPPRLERTTSAIGEAKKRASGVGVLRRSFSTGKEGEVSDALTRVRENVAKGRASSVGGPAGGGGVMKQNVRSSGIRRPSFGRCPLGKENSVR